MREAFALRASWQLSGPLLASLVLHALILSTQANRGAPLARPRQTDHPPLMAFLHPGIVAGALAAGDDSSHTLSPPASSPPPSLPRQTVIPPPTPTTAAGPAGWSAEVWRALPAPVRSPDLVEAARQFVRQEGQVKAADRMAAPASPTRPPTRPVSPIERATALREGWHEEALPGGGIRVTSASGQHYCLQPLPEAAQRDGPVSPTIIPMLCP